jgi:heme/copper-type cytochrome/quinol oxidase subunit 1
VGAFLLGVSVLLFLWILFSARRTGEPAGDNPWGGWTLEWLASSPPPTENFERVPPIRGRRPLWDLAHPERADELVRART